MKIRRNSACCVLRGVPGIGSTQSIIISVVIAIGPNYNISNFQTARILLFGSLGALLIFQMQWNNLCLEEEYNF